MATQIHTLGDRRILRGRGHGLARSGSGSAAAAHTSSLCSPQGRCAGHCSSRRPGLLDRQQLEEERVVLARAWTLSRMLGTPGPGVGSWAAGVGGGAGRPGDQHLEDAGRDGALMLSPALAAPQAFLGFPSAHHSGQEGCVLSHNRTTTTSTNYWTCPFHQVLFQALHVHFLLQSCNNSVRYYYPLFSHIMERSHFCFQRHDKVRGSAPEGPEEEPERG